MPWTPIEVDQWPASNRRAGWYWAVSEQTKGTLRHALAFGTGRNFIFVVSRVSDGRFVEQVGCGSLGSPAEQYVCWGYDLIAERYTSFLGWFSLNCQDMKLFSKQLQKGVDINVGGLSNPLGYKLR